MKPIFQITSTNELSNDQAVLAMQIGERHLGFAICNAGSNELNRLFFYTAESMNADTVKEIIALHPELQRSFAKVCVSYDHSQSLLIPLAEYTGKDPQLLLKEMYGINGLSATFTESITGWQLQNVYAIPSGLNDTMIQHFTTNTAQHHYTVSIRSAELAAAESILKIDFRTDEFSLLFIHQQQLLLAQTYIYATPADVIYVLLNVCQQYSLSQEEVRLELSGLVEKDSALYRDLYQYFLDIHFRMATWTIPATGEEQYPAHFFTSLNDLALCES